LFFRLLSLLAAFGILVLFGGPAVSLVAGLFTHKVDVQMTEADGTARPAVMGPNASYPAWILLPPDARIAGGAVFDDTPTRSGGGSVEIAAGDDGQALFAAWEARLRAAGYLVARRADPTDRLFAIEAGLMAEQPATGRRLQLLLRSIGPTRAAQFSFWEPYEAGK
jgi:hypothetical protein